MTWQLTSSGTSLDKGAAKRFIQHGIAGNKRLDEEQATRAKKRLEALDGKKAAYAGKKRKFDDEGEYLPEVSAIENLAVNIREDGDDDSITTNTTPEDNKLKNRLNAQSVAETGETPEQRQERKRQKRRAKKERRRQRERERDGDEAP